MKKTTIEKRDSEKNNEDVKVLSFGPFGDNGGK